MPLQSFGIMTKRDTWLKKVGNTFELCFEGVIEVRRKAFTWCEECLNKAHKQIIHRRILQILYFKQQRIQQLNQQSKPKKKFNKTTNKQNDK
jgi:hypothetical protein